MVRGLGNHLKSFPIMVMQKSKIHVSHEWNPQGSMHQLLRCPMSKVEIFVCELEEESGNLFALKTGASAAAEPVGSPISPMERINASSKTQVLNVICEVGCTIVPESVFEPISPLGLGCG